jgi:hypothetical protein
MVPVPTVYAEWYAKTEACLEVRGDFEAVRWFVADTVMVDGAPKAGVLRFPDDVTMFAEFTAYETPVRHEMAHHIMQAGDELHDARGWVPCQSG